MENITKATKESGGTDNLIDRDELELQDTGKKPLFLEADVKALYPSMDQAATAELAFQAVKNSDVSFRGINYKRLAVYLLLTVGEVGMRQLGIREAIPTRVGSDSRSTSLFRHVNHP